MPSIEGELTVHQDLIQECFQRFANCDSYVGLGRTELDTQTSNFKIVFKRDVLFYFEYWNKMGVSDVVWSSPQKTLVSGETYPSLSIAIASCTGTSNGAIHLIASLLIPELVSGSSKIISLKYQFAGQRLESGAKCTRFRAETGNDSGVQLWLSDDSNLIKVTQLYCSDDHLRQAIGRSLRDKFPAVATVQRMSSPAGPHRVCVETNFESSQFDKGVEITTFEDLLRKASKST